MCIIVSFWTVFRSFGPFFCPFVFQIATVGKDAQEPRLREPVKDAYTLCKCDYGHSNNTPL